MKLKVRKVYLSTSLSSYNASTQDCFLDLNFSHSPSTAPVPGPTVPPPHLHWDVWPRFCSHRQWSLCWRWSGGQNDWTLRIRTPVEEQVPGNPKSSRSGMLASTTLGAGTLFTSANEWHSLKCLHSNGFASPITIVKPETKNHKEKQKNLNISTYLKSE